MGFVFIGIVLGYPFPIPFYIGWIDHQNIRFVFFEAVDDEVVHDAAFFIGQGAVLGLTWGELRSIICRDALDKVECVFSFYDELAHMAYVEDTRVGADGLVFVVDAGVADGHVITCKFCHLSAKCEAFARERTALHLVDFEPQMYGLCLRPGAKCTKTARKTTEGYVPTSTNDRIVLRCKNG